jgi:hypothetical protein
MDADTQEANANPLEAGPPPCWPLPRAYADLSPEERAEFDRRMKAMAALASKKGRPPRHGFE